MKNLMTVAAVVGLMFAGDVLAEQPENPLAAIEKKLQGAWKGTAPCQGDLELRANGTYEKTHCGPGDKTFAGVWQVRWDALPPTLVLTCKTSDDPKAIGRKDEAQLIKLDDTALVAVYPSSDVRLEYARSK